MFGAQTTFTTGSRFGVEGLITSRVQILGSRVQGSVFMVQGLGHRVQGFEFRV